MAMKSRTLITALILLFMSLISCNKKEDSSQTNIIFLHHSTGLKIWGAKSSIATSLAFRVNKLYDFIGKKAELPMLFKSYNDEHNTN